MSRRPLVFVLGLTVGDYFLWNWSLNSNHAVLALISGLTFPPLALMLLWLLTVAVASLLASIARSPAARRRTTPRVAAAARPARPSRGPAPAQRVAAEGTKRGSAPGAPARKIAA